MIIHRLQTKQKFNQCTGNVGTTKNHGKTLCCDENVFCGKWRAKVDVCSRSNANDNTLTDIENMVLKLMQVFAFG